MTFVSIALFAIAGCAAIERNFHGDRVNERVLAEARKHVRLEMAVHPTAVHGGERVGVEAAISYDATKPIDVCTESGGLSTCLEDKDHKLIVPLRLYGITTDVACSRSIRVRPGLSDAASFEIVLPSRFTGTMNLCAGMSFNYCGVDCAPCALSRLGQCVPVTVESP